jgi:hypothetical protein
MEFFVLANTSHLTSKKKHSGEWAEQESVDLDLGSFQDFLNDGCHLIRLLTQQKRDISLVIIADTRLTVT